MANKVGIYIDNAIGTLFPKWGFQRAFNRARYNTMEGQNRNYEAAKDGRRASSWSANNNPSVNSLIAKDHKKLVARSRELNINNAYAKKAPYIIANNVVGTGIMPTPQVIEQIEGGKLKKIAKKKELEKTILAAWKIWADELNADYNGDFNFYGLQHLALRTIIISGEVLVIRKRVKRDENKLGFQLLIVEGDYIDVTRDTLKDTDGGFTFRGIKYNEKGKRTGYWIWNKHPTELEAKSFLVDIKDVLHCYDLERSGQNRGVPLAATTSVTQKDLGDYMDAELFTKKGAACFSAFVQKAEDPEGNNTGEGILESIEPGAVQYLKPGETIHFPSLPQNPGLSDFVKVQQRGIAAGYLMPYENLTGDLSNVTFISGRLGQIDFRAQIEYWQHTMFIPRFCNVVFKWFMEGAKIGFGFDEKLEVKATWTAPRRQMVDPTKEVAAMKEQVRAGFASWQEVVRESGYDPEEVLQQLTEDQKNFIAAGLMPTSSQYFELTQKVKMNKGDEKKPPEKAKE